ncbi:hypothetical protein J4731_01470 [Providencia rettgeri]|nr:hypothetical protein [Providencia rettgeri]
MLKLHEVKMSLALTQNNRFAGATQEPSYSRENYYCAHCGEPRHTTHKTPTGHGLPILILRAQSTVRGSSVRSRT